MNKRLLKWSKAFLATALLLGSQSAAEAQVTIKNPNETYKQNFDEMNATGTTFAPHWFGVKASGSSTTFANGATLPLVVTDGGANSGAIYNVGTTSETDRAFGTLASGSIIPRFGASFVNNTGQTITNIDLKGVMEQWRSGSSNTVNEVITFEYSLNATNLMEGSWTAVPAFNLVEKLTTTTVAAAVNGNLSENRTPIVATINGISWPAGTTLWIRWTDKDDSGSDGIYAIDEFELTAQGGGTVPMDNTSPTLATTNPFAPADNATDIALNTLLTVTFNEAVKAGTGNIIINNLTDGTSQSFSVTNTSAVSFNGSTITLTGATLDNSKNYAVQIPASAITDLAGNAFTGITDNTTWNFSTRSAPEVVVDNGTSLTTLNVAYTQNFDGMGTTGTSLPTNWFAVRASGTGTIGQALAPSATNGSATSGAIYNVGTTNDTDRALGTLSSGSTVPAFGAFFTNNTSNTITSIDIKGRIEQWRSGSNNTINEVVVFEYSLNATSLTDGTWTKLTSLDLNEKLTITTVAAAVDGNENPTEITGTLSDISWRVGNTLWIRWTDNDDTGSDGMYALDDFTLTPRAVTDVTAPTLATTNPLLPQAGELLADHEENLTITFSEIVETGTTGSITVKNITDNTTQQIALSTVTLNNNRATFPANLLPGKSYEVTVAAGTFEDLAQNQFAGIAAGAWTFTTAVPNPYAHNFNRCETNLPGGWLQYSATGDTEFWGCTSFGRTGNAVQMNGYNAGNKQNEDWLISPAYNLATGFTYPTLSFWSRTRFAGESLKLMVSTDYSGSGNPATATWKEINGIFPKTDSDVWTLSENINLSKFKGQAVYIAFVYTSTTSSASRWTLDDVAITNSETEPLTPVFFLSSLGPISNFDFGYVTGQSPTQAKSFRFYALDLKSNLTVTAPAGFEVSKDNQTFATTLTYTPEQTFDYNTIYVRFKNNASAPASFAGSVKFTSGAFNLQRGYLTATTLNKEATLDVVTWNIEWFGHASLGPADNDLQLANAKKMILDQDAELYCLEEIVNETAFKSLLSQLPGYRGFLSPYVSGTPGPNTQKVGFIYKTSALDSVTTRGLLQSPSNPTGFWASGRLPYLFVADATVAGVKKQIHFIAVHAKANENNSPEDAQSAYDRRISDLRVLKDSLDLYYPEANIMMLGDFNDDVDFTVANVPTTESTYKMFIDDAANYRAVTKDLSDAALRTYITFDNVIDHVLISDELYADYVTNSAKVIIPFDLIPDYASTTSDHLPVGTRFVLVPNVSFATATGNVAEEAGIYNLNLNLSRPSTTDQTLTVAVQTGAGVTPTDFKVENYTVTVPAGATKATLPVTILDDNTVEPDETLTFTVADATGSLGYDATTTFALTIQDNDKSVISFHAPTVALAENAGTYNITLKLDQPTVNEQTFTLVAQNGTGMQYGTAGDYTTTPALVNQTATVTVPAGATSATFALNILDDERVELTENVTFSLGAVSTKLAIGGQKTFTVTVTDNDKSIVSFSQAEASISENAGSYTVTLNLDQAPVINQTAYIRLTNSHGATYGTTAGSYTTQPAATADQFILNIPAGATTVSFKVILNSNTKKEADKLISFAVTSNSSALVVGNTGNFSLTVLDETNPEVKGIGSAEVQIAPNPSNGPVTLIFKDNAVYNATDLMLTLWNAQGQLVVTSTGNVQTITNDLNRALATTSKGMYILKVAQGTTYFNTRLVRE